MATINFPSNPLNNARFSARGKLYEYNSVKNKWTVVSGLTDQDAVATLAGLTDVAKVTPTNDHVLTYASANTTYYFAEASGGGVTSYANTSVMPLSNNSVGDQAFTTDTNRLYIWNGSGWFNIALVNQTPNITTGGAGSYSLATDGTATVITLVAEDPEGFDINWTYQVTSGTLANTATITQSNNVFTITPSTNIANGGEFSLTFSASDGVNIATDVNSFTLTFASSLWKDVTLNVGTSSTNGLQNKSFIDRSTNAHTVTAEGDAFQSSFHPYLDNWSVEFDGGLDYLSISQDSSLDPETGDFTIEAWLYNDTTDTTNSKFVASNRSGGSGGWIFQAGAASNGACNFSFVGYSGGGTTRLTLITSSSYELNQWYHVAAVKSGTTWTLYVNGVSAGSGTQSGDFSPGIVLWIGGDSTNSSRHWNGYISNLRIVKGTALYTSNFTPSTEKLTAVSGTSLLTCQSNRFVDNSTNDHTIGRAGDSKVSAYNPFGQDSEYAIGANKGSAYFDGSGDYLSVPSDASFDLGTGDYTVEFWVWRDNTSDAAFVSSRDNTGMDISYDGNTIRIGRSYVAWDTTFSGSALGIHQWNHVVIARNASIGAGSTTLWINGNLIQTVTNTNAYDLLTLQLGLASTSIRYLNGYLSDVRVVKGTAVYDSSAGDFTPPTAPVGNTNASIYLPMDNAGIFDKTGTNTLKLFGDVTTSTAQTKFADTSIYFDGNGDYITTNFPALGTDDFTIESWVYFNNITTFNIFDARETSSGTTHPALALQNDWRYISDNAYVIESGVTPSANQWYHFAICRNAGTTTLYIDGTSIGSASDSRNYLSNLSGNIGTFRTRSANFFPGYIENFQILKGVAKYTANFTPPTLTQGISTQTQS